MVGSPDQKGSVFLMTSQRFEEARALLGEPPLAKLMEYEFTELGSLTPLHLLIEEA